MSNKHQCKNPLDIGHWIFDIGYSRASRGFTLIELLIVIGIIAILSAMTITIVNPLAQFEKSRDAQRKSDIAQIQRALEQYYQDTGSYPLSTPSNSNTPFEIIGLNSSTVVFGTTNSNNWPYMNKLPQDPDGNRTYVYYSTGQSYYIYASLERGSQDPQACNKGSACSNLSTNSIPLKACGNTCNYGVTSPNTTP